MHLVSIGKSLIIDDTANCRRRGSSPGDWLGLSIMQGCIVFILLVLVSPSIVVASSPSLVIQSGHRTPILSVAISPDGRLAVSGSVDNSLKLWDTLTGLELMTLKGHSGPVTDVAFSPDGSTIISACSNQNLKVWDVKSGQPLLSNLDVKSSLLSRVAFSPDGSEIATAGAFGLRIWNSRTGDEIRLLVDEFQILSALAWSPDGKVLYVGSDKGDIRAFEAASGRLVLTVKKHSKPVNSLAISPDGLVVASSDLAGVIRLWRSSDGKVLETINGKLKSHTPIVFSPDGKKLISGHDDGTLKYWSVQDGHLIETLPGHTDAILDIALSGDGKTLLTGGTDRSLRFRDAQTGQLTRTISEGAPALTSLAFSENGKLALVSLSDKTLQLWDMSAGRILQTHPGPSSQIYRIVLSPDNRRALFLVESHRAVLWDVVKGEMLSSIDGVTEYTPSMAISPDSNTCALSVGEQHIEVRNTATGKILTKLTDKKRLLTGLTFSPGSRELVAGYESGEIVFYDLASGALKRTARVPDVTVQTLRYSPDGHFLAVGARKGHVYLFDNAAGDPVRTFEGHTDLINTLTFSPDGTRLLSTSSDYSIRLWDTSSGKSLQALTGHNARIFDAAFSENGRTILSGSYDGFIKFWRAGDPAELASLVILGGDEWVMVTPHGHFDGSAGGTSTLHFVQDLSVIPLEGLFEKYYTPRLYAMITSGAKPGSDQSAPSIASGIKLPPRVVISSPSDRHISTADAVTVKASIVDQGDGIDEIRVYHNGKLMESLTRGLAVSASTVQGRLDKEFEITLLPGENTVTVTAFNASRTESPPATITILRESSVTPPSSSLYLLVVGINEYKNSTYNLNYGQPDAAAFITAIEAKSSPIFQRQVKHLFFDKQAIRTTIERAFRDIAAKAAPEDVFVFYYAGHGVMSEGDEHSAADYYLALHEVTQLYGREDLLRTKGLSANEIKNWCTDIAARKQLLIIDACQAGGSVETFAFRGAAEQRAIAQLARSTGLIVLASSGTEQFASEFSQLGHGVFTYALLQGLSGAADGGVQPDGKITVKELEAWLNDQVPELTRQFRGSPQYPNSYARGNDFPLVMK